MSSIDRFLDVLHLTAPFSAEQLKAAYHTQARAWHPDRHPDPAQHRAATERFHRIQEAYDFLQGLLDAQRASEAAFLSLGRHDANQPQTGTRLFSTDAIGRLDERGSVGLLFNLFGMDSDLFSLLWSMIAGLYEEDLADPFHPIWMFPQQIEGDNDEKRAWFIAWQDLARRLCSHPGFRPRPSFWADRSAEYKTALTAIREARTPFRGLLLAIELASFDLYWPLPDGRGTMTDPFMIDDVHLQEHYAAVIAPLGVDPRTVSDARHQILDTAQRLYSTWRDLHRRTFPRGDGTLFGAALATPRHLPLSPKGQAPRRDGLAPDALAISGSGMRAWIHDAPRFMVIGGGGALFVPVIGTGSGSTGLWNLPEILLSLAKIELIADRISHGDPRLAFCRGHLGELRHRLGAHFEDLRGILPAAHHSDLEMILRWVELIKI